MNFSQVGLLRKQTEADLLFLEMSKDMTRGELETLIAKRPNLWGRWEAWLEKLPENLGSEKRTK